MNHPGTVFKLVENYCQTFGESCTRIKSRRNEERLNVHVKAGVKEAALRNLHYAGRAIQN